jgi:hypothetical protein
VIVEKNRSSTVQIAGDLLPVHQYRPHCVSCQPRRGMIDPEPARDPDRRCERLRGLVSTDSVLSAKLRTQAQGRQR